MLLINRFLLFDAMEYTIILSMLSVVYFLSFLLNICTRCIVPSVNKMVIKQSQLYNMYSSNTCN